MAESKWDQFDFDNKITAILHNIAKDDPQHYGQPFFTAYQLAIEFAHRYPDEFVAIRKPVGGSGTGKRNSLSQYIAVELSKRIKSRSITNVEIAFIHPQYLQDMVFNHDAELVRASTPEAGYGTSIFRLIS